MINRVVLVGRLTKDPELRYTPSGIPMTRFTVAVNRAFSNQSGEREADFISCVAWRKQAENLANFMKKGSLIGVDGRIQTGSFEGQDGKRVYTTDVVADSVQFLEPRNWRSFSKPTVWSPAIIWKSACIQYKPTTVWKSTAGSVWFLSTTSKSAKLYTCR